MDSFGVSVFSLLLATIRRSRSCGCSMGFRSRGWKGRSVSSFALEPAGRSVGSSLQCSKKTKPKAEMLQGGALLLARDGGEQDRTVVYTRAHPPSKLRWRRHGAAPICRSITGALFGLMTTRGARGDSFRMPEARRAVAA